MDNDYSDLPVPAQARKSSGSFWSLYAGEHTAGTEFMIGPLFLAAGVSARDLVLGLLVGNLLAVVTWRVLTTPIALAWRLTLYRQLELIGGRRFVVVYNAANGLLFCFLAGAMITVSATAVGMPFDMNMPALDATLPTGTTWVIVVMAIGVLFTVFAAFGYDWVSRVASVAAPWMLVVFFACGLVALPQLGVHDIRDFWSAASTEIWRGGEPLAGQIKFTFWHVMSFAWFCNAAVHLGMGDLSILRFARHKSAGWAPAGGMFLGHYMAWIAASLLYAIQLRSDPANTAVLPGPLAFDALGLTGTLCVVIAGWTTANPTIYRAGLAFQAIVPRSSRFVVTCVAGAIATVAGLFPALAMKLLGFVGLYGTILAPIGAIIAVDHFLLRGGRVPDRVPIPPSGFAWRVAGPWLLSLAACAVPFWLGVFPSFLTFPAWLGCGAMYWLLTRRSAVVA